MTKKAKWIFAVIFSSLISILTVFLIREYLQQETSRRIEQASKNTRNVIVFADKLRAGKTLNTSDLLLRKYPEELINSHWYLESSAGLIIGRQLRMDVQPGEPVSDRFLLSARNNGLSEKLPNDFYAITVNTDNLGHHNAMLKVGDVVDIVFLGESFNRSNRYVAFDDIEIFEVHGIDEGYGTYSLTLLIRPEEVKDFTKALGNPMLVWARGHDLPKFNVWIEDSKKSEVAPWTVM